MTNFSKTCTNILNVFGRADLWNDYDWNAFKWGDGTADLPIRFTKVIDNTVTPDTTIPIKIFVKVVDNSVTPTSDMVKYFSKVVDNAITPTSDMVKYAIKVIDNSITPASDMVLYFVKVIDNATSVDTDMVMVFTKILDNDLAVTADMVSESLQEPNGWYYVFTGDATNIEDKVTTTYASGAGNSAASWGSLVEGNATSWS